MKVHVLIRGDLSNRRSLVCFMYWKQWRLARTKVRNLLKLGASKKVAIPIAMSRKGPWNLSRTLATQVGMTPPTAGLKEQGFVSIKEI